MTRLCLTGAMQVLNNGFRYDKELVGSSHAELDFSCEVDGISVNGVDIMSFDVDGKIMEFNVMVRPVRAVNVLHARMRAMQEQLAG